MEIKKKVIKKIAKKPASNGSQVAKITSKTLEVERREVLKNARKFKYPVQYGKHKIVINAMIISVILILAGLGFTILRLYSAQDTGSLIYRITKFLPFSVAKIDDENVRYSDYLMDFRANAILIERRKGEIEVETNPKALRNSLKTKAMENALKNAYALKIARENNIKITDAEIAEEVASHRKAQNIEISESAFYESILANYGLSASEYRRMFVELPLYRNKVSAFLDKNAEEIKNQVVESLKADTNFDSLAQKFGDKIETGKSGNVRHTNIDGGRTRAALALKEGEVSAPFISKSGDGYYIVKLLKKSDTDLSYEYAKIPLTAFEQKIKDLKSSDKVKEFIKIEGR